MSDITCGCGCPTNEIGDIRCHVCGERVNVRCWNCRTLRGEGVCPNPTTAARLVELREALGDTRDLWRRTRLQRNRAINDHGALVVRIEAVVGEMKNLLDRGAVLNSDYRAAYEQLRAALTEEAER